MSIQVYRPVKSNRVGQRFGESKACALALPSGKLAFPYKVVSKKNNKCPVGYVSLYEALGSKGHAGEDYGANHREPIHFDIDAKDMDGNPMEWEVMGGYSPSTGHNILIRSLKPVKLENAPVAEGASLNLIQRMYERLGGGVHLMRFYGHMDEPTHLKNRQKIKFGDKVGLSGTTGMSSGVHVHRHLLVCGTNDENPFFYLDGDSHYKGRINEEQWFINDFAFEVRTLQERANKLAWQALNLAMQLLAKLRAQQKSNIKSR